MTQQAAQAMDLEFQQAGVNPHDTLPLLGRYVWSPALRQLPSGGIRCGAVAQIVTHIEQLGGTTVFDIGNADMLVIPTGLHHRYTAHVRTAASRSGIGILFECHIDALVEANSGRAHGDLATAI